MTKQTRPPPRHTEATLLGAMESAGRDIADEELRAAMRDSGLGTPATRAATIETLIRRTFVARDGEEPGAHRDGHRAHRRAAGEEPGLARADRHLGGAPLARGARRGDARRVHGGHLALRERRRDRDPRRRRDRAGGGGAAVGRRRRRARRGAGTIRPGLPSPRARSRRAPSQPTGRPAQSPPPRSPARAASRAPSSRETAAGAAPAGARAARS